MCVCVCGNCRKLYYLFIKVTMYQRIQIAFPTNNVFFVRAKAGTTSTGTGAKTKAPDRSQL